MNDVTMEYGCSPAELRKQRQYKIEYFSACALYAVTLVASVAALPHVTGPARVAVALLPLTGILAMTWALVRFMLRVDEFQRQTMLISAAIAAVVGAVVTMTLGLLEEAGFSHMPMTAVWPIIALGFGVSLPFVRRRYR